MKSWSVLLIVFVMTHYGFKCSAQDSLQVGELTISVGADLQSVTNLFNFKTNLSGQNIFFCIFFLQNRKYKAIIGLKVEGLGGQLITYS